MLTSELEALLPLEPDVEDEVLCGTEDVVEVEVDVIGEDVDDDVEELETIIV